MHEAKVKLKLIGKLGLFLTYWSGAVRVGVVIDDAMLGFGVNKLSRPLRTSFESESQGRRVRQTDGFFGPFGYLRGTRVHTLHG